MNRINYRGPFAGCNYACSYCPLKRTGGNLAADQKCLTRFVDFIRDSDVEEPYSILFTPYGEALLYDYYIEALAVLSRVRQVSAVSVQTNFSFDERHFLKVLADTGAEFSKIKLWCTFHPKYVTAAAFAKKANHLSKSIELSAGAVGVEGNLPEILRLRRALDSEIYLWINAEENREAEYSAQTIKEFGGIDPFFMLQLQKRRCNLSCGGLCVDGRGNVTRCVRNKEYLGNLYSGILKMPMRTAKCDCFLSYNNRADIPENRYVTHGRLIERRPAEAIFFDVDGTLTGNKEPPEDIEHTLEFLSARYRLFFATALPYSFVEKNIGGICRYFSGGVFAEGAMIAVAGKEISVQPLISPLMGGTEYRSKDVVYKRVYENTSENRAYVEEGIGKNARFILQDNTIGVVAKSATKQKGIQIIARRLGIASEHIVTVGDSENDKGMLDEYSGFSVGDRLKGYLKIQISNLPFLLKTASD